MPTPSPTMVASVGAVVATSVTAASSVIPDTPAPSPASATTSGRPAATTEPNASSRITSAAPTPIASATPLGAVTFSGTWPPNSTWCPASLSPCVADLSRSRVSPGSSSVTGTEYRTVISAVVPSALGTGGSTTLTCGISRSSPVAAASAAWSTAPERACTTTLASAPDSAGKRSSSRSVACCDPVPSSV
ncbi:hypothetical protein GCM10010208_16330 [Actinomadura livida]|nr:hypothetical protein GCM10010208_16330 [Actinomadura livida]